MQDLEKQNVSGSSRWKPGQSGNPNGRPFNPERRQLQNALRSVKKNHNNIEFLHHVADEAYKNNNVAMKVLDKLIPNAENPKDNENTGFKQLIIVRTDSDQAQRISGQVHLQPEEVSRDVEQLGHREDDVIDLKGYVVQRASEE